MIDTDKYEGHLIDKAVEDNSQVWVWKNWMLKNAETIEQHKATAALLHDAPKLLAEVKRLREENHTLEMMAWEYESVWDWLMSNTRLCGKLLLLIEEWKEEDGLVTIEGVTFRKEMIE